MSRQYFQIQAVYIDFQKNLTVHGTSELTQHLSINVKLTDPGTTSDPIEDLRVLVGNDIYFKTVKGQTEIDGLHLVHTAGDFIIAGYVPAKFRPKNVTIKQNMAIVTKVNTDSTGHQAVSKEPDSLTQEVENFWRLETVGELDNLDTPEDSYGEQTSQGL